jgi:hypothetical protein
MRYRIITSGEGFTVRCKFKWWPFWTAAFMPGFGWFLTIDDAEKAIAKRGARKKNDGRVVKEL